MPKDDDARFTRTHDQSKLLRWLADELDAGRAQVNLAIEQESEVVERPRSWTEPYRPPVMQVRKLGSAWAITARTLKAAPIEDE